MHRRTPRGRMCFGRLFIIKVTIFDISGPGAVVCALPSAVLVCSLSLFFAVVGLFVYLYAQLSTVALMSKLANP